MPETRTTTPPLEVYSPAARHFHWITVALIGVQVPVGVWMAYRGNTLNLWDGLTNNLYSTHKLLGLVILMLVIARLAYRFSNGAPADEPTLENWQKGLSHLTHWAIYALLILVPIGGWLGISYFPALSVFGVSIPGLVSPDQAKSAVVLYYHMLGAFALVALIGMHVGAALFHHFIRRDGVLTRMLPSLPRRDRA